MPDVTYILAAYRGRRDAEEYRYVRDPDHYLRRHFRALSTLRHSLAEILVVLNEDGERPLDLPTSMGGTPVRLLRRPNRGLSYGAFAHGVEHVETPWLIMMEDDYVPTVDEFDRILLERIQGEKEPGFCCGAVEYKGQQPQGAPVFLGIASTEATRKILSIGYDAAPIVRQDNSRETGGYSQIAWSRSYMVAGFSLKDWFSKSYGCLTWVSEKKLGVWFDEDSRPGHAILNPRTIRPPSSSSQGSVVIGHTRARGRRVNVAPRHPTKTTSLPDHVTSRRSMVLPQQAIDQGIIDLQIGRSLYKALVRDDGSLVSV